MRPTTTLVMTSLLAACTQEVTIRTDDGSPKDDPNRPDFDSAIDATPPVAICAARPNPAAPGEAVDLLGEGSYDPDGSEIISYTWQLPVRPDGSRARLPTGTANLVDFLPDVLGTYVATLDVVDESGTRSTACSTELSVRPTQKLYVELRTTYEDDDLELVVVKGDTIDFPLPGPNCTMPADPQSCSGKACDGIEWGQAGVTDDNPVVLSDDDQGGVEAIAIEVPAVGVYTVGVYDRIKDAWISAHDATVAVYVNGQRVWAGTKSLSLECTGAAYVQVAMPSGATTPL